MPELVARANLTDEVSEVGYLLEMLTRGRPAWMKDAGCLEHPELNWFPGRGENARPAVRVCEGCLVRWPCLEWALATSAEDGIFGGFTAPQRRKIHLRPGGAA